MTEPILSIAIPTYGYPEGIIANVTKLLTYERQNIEIIVVDNDETGEQIKHHMMMITDQRFHYYQNKENIGRSNNVAKAVEKASIDNVLLLSSDDELLFDAVDEIIDLLQKNTPYGLMLGTINTNTGGYGFDPKIPGTYHAGSEALSTIPFLGDLMPMVINRKYLDFNNLYEQNEQYMQLRMALMTAKKGNLIYLHHILGNMVAPANSHLENGKLSECFFHGYTPEKWDVNNGGIMQYSPEGRIMQLKNYLQIIEDCCERRDQKLRVIEKWVVSLMAKSLQAIPAYMSPVYIRMDGYIGHLHYTEVLENFKNEMMVFFQEREKKGEYYYSGHLQDLINNELLLIQQGKFILQNILNADKVFIYGNSKKEKNLQGLLTCMGIDSQLFTLNKNIKGELILVDSEYDLELEKDLLQNNPVKTVLFMDRMAKYLTIVWCSEHEGEEYCKEYLAYLD